MRVLFEGNILLTAWLQDLHCISLTELTFSLFISWLSEFLPPPVWSMLRFCFLAPRNRSIHWLSFFLSLLPLSRLYFANKQSPVDTTINSCWVWLHGNFVFNCSIWCIWNSGPFNSRCQCQEMKHQVNYSQINQICSIIHLCLWTVFLFMLFITTPELHSAWCTHTHTHRIRTEEQSGIKRLTCRIKAPVPLPLCF